MEIVNRFLNFDKLIGSMLVKFLYYCGIVGIVLATLGISSQASRWASCRALAPS